MGYFEGNGTLPTNWVKRTWNFTVGKIGTFWVWVEKGDVGKCVSKILARATWSWLMGACRTLP